MLDVAQGISSVGIFARKFGTAKTPYGENSVWRNFRTTKNPDDENSVRRKLRTAKYPYDKKSYGENSCDEISYGENSAHGLVVISAVATSDFGAGALIFVVS